MGPEHSTPSGPVAPLRRRASRWGLRPQTPGLRASLAVVIGRIVILAVAAMALVSGFVLARDYDRARDGSVAPYVCPMHPEIVSREPSDCPICGMALELVEDLPRSRVSASANNGFTDIVKLRASAEQVRAPAWLGPDGVVTAVLYTEDLLGRDPGEHASFFSSTAPNLGVDASLLAEPPVPVDPSTAKVRFRVDPAAEPLASPGDVGTLRLTVRPRELLVVPESAVLFSAQSPYVLAAARDGEPFTKRPVQIGRSFDSWYVVLSGLREGERVVVGDTFFLDAERRLSAARGRKEGSP
jgi:Heavy metal binding domain